MIRTFLFLLIPFLLFACSNETEEVEDTEITEQKGIEFKTFEEQISYCIGFDSGFAINQVYNGTNTAGKFSVTDIEAGLVDYLGDGELRIDVFSIDSILDLYLGENGEVDESFVSKKEASYAVGLIEARTLVGSLVGRGIDQTMEIDFLVNGVKAGMHNDQSTYKLSDIRLQVTQYYSDMNLKMGQSFLDQNAKNEGVIVTESGLQYEIITEGTGLAPKLTDSCVVHYTGRFIDGRVFESTIPSLEPAGFTPMGVIRGWQEGLLLMKEGGSSRFFIPYDLAYGPEGSGPIEPYSTLVFDIELLKVIPFHY